MLKFLNVVIVSLLFAFLFFSFSTVRDAMKEEKIQAAYEQLEEKGGMAVFEGLALVQLESLGGKYSYQDLVGSRGAKKHILKDPVTGDRYVGVSIYIGCIGIFKVSEEGKILQKLTKEEFYELGVVDRLVK